VDRRRKWIEAPCGNLQGRRSLSVFIRELTNSEGRILHREMKMERETEMKELTIQDLNILLDATEQMRNHFRAFERIKDVIQVLINANRMIAELNERARAVETTIERLRAEKEKIQAELDAAAASVAQHQESERRAREKLAEAEMRLQEIREMVQKALGDRQS
jgi:DNA repair exonuclease SbcCD ATPase subunit